VLDQQPENEEAMSAIAMLYLNQKKLDEAQVWYQKLTVVNPDNKQAFRTLGVIAWTRGHQAVTEARAKLGMRPEDPGPIKDPAARQALREKYLSGVQEGIENLNRAVEIEAEYDDAMSDLNLLYREKADLENSAAEYREDIAKADEWMQKALGIRKEKASRRP